ncbi:MAG TPA: hypothetical protein PLO14_16010, partial [Accumulibacter sp.]|nr:hypothetical protein [Accumulibacter sp.]
MKGLPRQGFSVSGGNWHDLCVSPVRSAGFVPASDDFNAGLQPGDCIMAKLRQAAIYGKGG